MGNLTNSWSNIALLLLMFQVAAISCQGPRIYPTDGTAYQFQRKQQRNTKCNACMSVVSNIKHGLESNATTEEIQEVVNGVCEVSRVQFTVQTLKHCK